ncbi:MAG: putative UDP-glucose 4-epimerase [Devosia sp.]|uniref:NAD-dependent epimerase/dehydratase family protein n=1 Tax=Devosia sp. TaxID=1871048 RepID=UPI002632BD7E|nr:SDR family oxidoreductase [Devosia sp.]MDB5526950.1 putative UDP-glucose 4-epimerase [Devosia sp.]
MRLLLTGGFGYLGGRLAQHLAGQGAEIVLGSRRALRAPAWLPDAQTVSLDWESLNGLADCCRDIDTVFHLAGMNAADCARDPVGALAFNGLATARLVEAAASQGVRRLIHVSTAHVYASPLAGVIDEATPPVNLHPYATSHRAGEDAVRAAHTAGRIEGVVIRLSNAFGAPADASADCWTLLVNDLARQAARSGRLVLKSGGCQQRDFIAISDFCRMTSALLDLPDDGLAAGVFNIGGGQSLTVLEMAERVAARFAALTAIACPIVRPEDAVIGQSDELQYKMARIDAAGITLPRAASIDAEIDALLQFCLAETR